MTPTLPDGTVAGGDWIHQADDSVTLTASRCRACGSTWFPPHDVCATCASPDTTTEPSDSHGVVYASTRIHIGPPGFEPPYVLSYVDIGALRILAHTRSAHPLPPGTPVRLEIGPIGTDEHGTVTSYLVTADLSEGTPR